MEYVAIIIFVITLAVIVSKIKSNAEKRNAMFVYMRSLSEFLLVIEKNPYVGEEIRDRVALLFNLLRNGGYIKSAEAKLVEDNGNPKIRCELKILVPNSVLDSLSDALMEPDAEKRYASGVKVLNGLTENMGEAFERLLGKDFISEFFSNFHPVFSYSDDESEKKETEYVFVKSVSVPDEDDPALEICYSRVMAEIEKEKSHTSFADKIKEHKDVCILFACGLAAATVSALLLYFSDSFFINGIRHLGRYISLMGYPTGLEFHPATVIVGVMAVLISGSSVAIFVVCLWIALKPDENNISLGKHTIKKYLPVIVSLMVCVSSHISLPMNSIFWSDVLGEKYVFFEQLFGCISPVLIWFCLIWIMLFVLSDVLEFKWLSMLAITVSLIVGMLGLAVLVFQNVSMLWYLIPHIGTTFAFAMGAGIWSVI